MTKKIFALIICLFAISRPVMAFPVSSEACIVICADTNQVLYGENYHKKMGMASTTKIMTAILALENGNTSDFVTVSQNAANQEGSSIYLKPNDRVLLSHLIYGLMLNSGNDAAIAIAEHIAKTSDNFVLMMNEKAKELGCKNTHFANPSGLPDEKHYSSAYDMAIIMSYALKNDEFAKIVATKDYKLETENSATYLRNHNKLLWQYPYCTGGKTGYTKASGRCFVSSATKDGVSLVAVTLSAPDDWRDHQNLLDAGFKKVQLTTVIHKNDILCTRKVRGVRVNILSKDNFSVPLKNGKKHQITCKICLDETVNGEINYGTHLGIGKIYVGDVLVGNINLVSGQDITSSPNNTFYYTLKRVLRQTILKK